jgi:hypothetical protein
MKAASKAKLVLGLFNRWSVYIHLRRILVAGTINEKGWTNNTRPEQVALMPYETP